jgi:hypothetical protein
MGSSKPGQTLPDGRLVVALLFLLLGFSSRSTAQERDHLQSALSAWRTRRAGTVTIDYVAEGKGCYVKGSYNSIAASLGATGVGDVPAADHEFSVRFRFAAHLSERKVRKERREDFFAVVSGKPLFYVQTYWHVFDGRQGVRFAPDPREISHFQHAPQLTKLNDDALAHFLDSMDYPFLLPHGVIPYLPRNLRIDDLGGTVDKLAYTVVSNPRPETENLLILRTPSLTTAGDDFFELWADPVRDYVITRFVRYKDGVIRESISLDYRRNDVEYTLSGWEHSSLDGGAISEWYSLRVTQARFNSTIPESEFLVSEQPGMMVSDLRSGAYYRAGKGPGDATPLSVIVKREARSRERSLLSWGLWIGVPITLLFVAVAVLALLRRR